MRRPQIVTVMVLAYCFLVAGCDRGGTAASSPVVTMSVPELTVASPSTTATTTAPSSAVVTPSATTTSPAAPVITWRPTTAAEREALAKEAEQVYREYKKLRISYEAKGGVNGPLPEPLKKYVAGGQARSVEDLLQGLSKIDGYQITGAENLRIVRKGMFVDKLEPEALIGVEFCDDASALTVRTAQETSRGDIFLNWSEFARGSDGRLRIVYNETKRAAKCE